MVEGKEVTLTNTEKIYFPELGASKAELIEYYIRMAEYICLISKAGCSLCCIIRTAYTEKRFIKSSAPPMHPNGFKAFRSFPKTKR